MSSSRIKKIIFLLDNLFCERDYHRFGIELLQANGFEVLIWDLTPIINPVIYKNIQVPDHIKYCRPQIFSDVAAIQHEIFNLGNDCFFIIICHYCPNFYPILKLISQKKLPYCFELSGSSVPLFSDYIDSSCKRKNEQMIVLEIFNKIKKINSRSLKEYIFQRIPYKLLSLRPADFIIAGGAKSKIHLYRVPRDIKTKILNVHYYDYDNYLAEMRESPSIIDQNTGVFLDQYVPFHPEHLLTGSSSQIKAEEYYPYLRKIFDYLEDNFKVKIIIAAHPRAHYDNGSDYFGGRPAIPNKTCELVRKAGFVIAHHSYSLNYAVLFKKPILFLTSEEFEKSSHGPFINLMANILGKTPIFMDRPYTFDWKNELAIDTARYQAYKHNHIKMDGTEELPFWQVIANYIKSNY